MVNEEPTRRDYIIVGAMMLGPAALAGVGLLVRKIVELLT